MDETTAGDGIESSARLEPRIGVAVGVAETVAAAVDAGGAGVVGVVAALVGAVTGAAVGDVTVDAAAFVVFAAVVDVEAARIGVGGRENEPISLTLPPSLALSPAPRSNGAHRDIFFFFFKVYLKGPRDSSVMGLDRVGSELSSKLLYRLLLRDDIAASANVRGAFASPGM